MAVAPRDLVAYAQELGIDPADELLPQAMDVPLTEAWTEHRKDGRTFYFNSAQGRSSWTHPRRDAFLQRYIGLKINRDYEGGDLTTLKECLDGLARDGGLDSRRETLMSNVSLSSQLLSEFDDRKADYAEVGVKHGDLLGASQGLLRSLLADIDQLKQALRRGAVENKELEMQLETNNVLIRLERERRDALAAQVQAQSGRQTRQAKIGRVRPTAPRPSADELLTAGATVRFSMSPTWSLFEGATPSTATQEKAAAAAAVAPAGKGSEVVAFCSGVWALQEPPVRPPGLQQSVEINLFNLEPKA
eukprot:COSAG05_NODE_1095_length_5901_cov_26.506205_1_plen_304_part_00